MPIVDHLPLGSDTATVEDQKAYIDAAFYDSNNPADLPGYIPGQRNIIEHDLVELIEDAQAEEDAS